MHPAKLHQAGEIKRALHCPWRRECVLVSELHQDRSVQGQVYRPWRREMLKAGSSERGLF
ncbi:hypothetical protein JG688_00017638 [Phytophthora aleatoria]|uniref:Uncharacterized protein n=1 Tax=Phytophthora aleatoria TaxID=2496075 RepID=A0A8J5M171_9STRA|nr:hypothetical protein JG688_00017638 [Phytophthora aleatoria]